MVKAETFMAEGEGRLEPGTEAEQSRPVQPDGSSSHTEVLTTTPEPEVNEVKRICIHSLSLKKNRRFLKGNDVIFYQFSTRGRTVSEKQLFLLFVAYFK